MIETITEVEARATLYDQITTVTAALSFLDPHLTVEDVGFEVGSQIEMLMDQVYYVHLHGMRVDEAIGILADIAMLEMTLTDVLIEIQEAFRELFPAPTAPKFQSL